MPWFKKNKFICDGCGRTKVEPYGIASTYDSSHWIVKEKEGLVFDKKVIIKDDTLCGHWRQII